jgi:hypothetical protein
MHLMHRPYHAENPFRKVTVSVEYLDQLRKAIRTYENYSLTQIGEGTLHYPLGRVHVGFKPIQDRYDLAAQLPFVKPVGTFKIPVDETDKQHLLHTLGAGFDAYEERGEMIVVKGPHGKEMVLGFSDNTIPTLVISTGKMYNQNAFKDTQVTESPKRNQTSAEIEETVGDFATTLERVINRVYSIAQTTPPTTNFIITGPFDYEPRLEHVGFDTNNGFTRAMLLALHAEKIDPFASNLTPPQRLRIHQIQDELRGKI